MRVVLDCNVVVSAARVDGTCRKIIDRAVREHEIVLSGPILSEYLEIAAHQVRQVSGQNACLMERFSSEASRPGANSKPGCDGVKNVIAS